MNFSKILKWSFSLLIKKKWRIYLWSRSPFDWSVFIGFQRMACLSNPISFYFIRFMDEDWPLIFGNINPKENRGWRWQRELESGPCAGPISGNRPMQYRSPASGAIHFRWKISSFPYSSVAVLSVIRGLICGRPIKASMPLRTATR